VAFPAAVLPLAVVVNVEIGESLMAAAERQGLYWPTVCHGDAECGTCAVVVEEGAEHLCPCGAKERQTLAAGRWAGDPRARLACQLRLTGPVRVFKRGVRTIEQTPGI
jgi:ferredoxin